MHHSSPYLHQFNAGQGDSDQDSSVVNSIWRIILTKSIKPTNKLFAQNCHFCNHGSLQLFSPNKQMLLFWVVQFQRGRSLLKGHTQEQKAVLASQSCEFHVGQALGVNFLKSTEKIIAADADRLSGKRLITSCCLKEIMRCRRHRLRFSDWL